MELKCGTTRRGYSVIEVGGGSFTNTFQGTFVIDRNGMLKRSIFTRGSGPLACSSSQAIVPIEKGDFIIKVEGNKPFSGANIGNMKVLIVKSTTRGNKTIEVEEIGEMPDIFPGHFEKICQGINKYHNRDGSLFCG